MAGFKAISADEDHVRKLRYAADIVVNGADDARSEYAERVDVTRSRAGVCVTVSTRHELVYLMCVSVDGWHDALRAAMGPEGGP